MARRKKENEFDINKPITVAEIVAVLQSFDEEVRKVNEDVVIETLKEALAKAYIKEIDAPDAKARVEVENGEIRLYHDLEVVAQDPFDELEITLEDAQKIDPNIEIGQFLAIEKNVRLLGRSAALHVKNILKQKVRETEKQAVYDEYSQQLGEIVYGFIESVEEKFVLVNLGRTLAIMPKSQQIPNEIYKESSRIRVLVKEVKKETKGAQVIVSRADAMFIKRLFEKEVPEIYQGTVEIKAIAREAGERTKMAVYSKDPNVDAIGACIGPRGQRIQAIIDEAKGEKIDVFQWSEDIGLLIKNSFAPALVLACFYSDSGRTITVVVDDSQLSLAIGRKGKNVKLAVKATGKKIELKTKQEMEEAGVDYLSLAMEFEAIQKQMLIEKQEARNKELAEELAKKKTELETLEDYNPFEVEEAVLEENLGVEESDKIDDQIAEIEEEVVVQKPQVEPQDTLETVAVEVENKVKEPKLSMEELKNKNQFVSKYEELASSTSKTLSETRKKKKKKDDERKYRNSELVREKDYDFRVEYSDDELEEIEALEEEIAANSWIEDDEIDFDEYDSYYDEDM